MIYVVGERLGTGRSRGKLAALIGVPETTMMEHVVWINLWDYPGGRPDLYATAIERAALPEDSIILLGREVAAQFALDGRAPLTLIERNGGIGPAILLLPHPSGLNRWYNDEGQESAARDALHRLWIRSAL